MNRFDYRAYYQYNGPSHADLFRSPKNSHEISEALRCFPNELPHYLSDRDATVSVKQSGAEVPDSISVFVTTILDETTTDEAVERCLNELNLFGEKLKQV